MTASTTVQKLSELREPPEPGRFYLVPFVEHVFLNKVDRWPVLGPMHTDVEHFNFPAPHYHVDPRFLTASQAQRVSSYWGLLAADLPKDERIAAVLGGYPLTQRHGDKTSLPKGRPGLMRRKCRSAITPYMHGGKAPVHALRSDFADPAQPIRKADGRLLCPHRKVDLSTLVPDAQGVVTCPLHGLRVQCRRHG